jgi:threonine/homoserine/homoserine lactone efflux protein
LEGSFLAFFTISAIVIMTPGQDTALTVRNSLAAGKAGGLATAFGVSCGQMLWVIATSLGVVAILSASETIFSAVKLAGAGYLMFLGLQSLRAAFNGSADASAGQAGKSTGLSRRKGFLQGVISNLGNPKMAAFFASLLPQFMPQGDTAFSASMLLGLMFCTMTFLWLASYAVFVEKAGKFLQRPGVRRSLDGITGMALLGLGLRIAASES